MQNRPVLQIDSLLHGGDYNPEQWYLDESVLKEDFKRLKDAGVNTVSVGIFSWTLYEKEEGVFEFDFMDQLLDRLASEGIKAYLATPSGSKPMWMSEKYPEIRRVGIDGLRERSGRRHNHCPSSPVYREKVAQINTLLAKRYSGHPALAMWHISNELQGVCYCDICLGRFREWLEERYGSLNALNEAWWTRFWNHTFTDWQQIDPRDVSIDGMLLDWRRFNNDLHIEFLENEIKPLREFTPDVPVTTNFMGFHGALDYWRWSQILDVVTNDSYPSFDGEKDMIKKVANTAMIHDLMRGMARGRQWLQIECTPSAVNWKRINKLKPRGVHQTEIAQVVAHGGEGALYFQVRKGRGGFEKFHGAIIDHDSRDDTRVYKEVAQTGKWLKENSHLAGSSCQRAEVAILHDWESQWALNSSCGIRQPHESPIQPQDAYHYLLQNHHRGWWNQSVTTDFLWPDDKNFANSLKGRRVVLAPALYLLKEETAKALTQFVERGGCLVLTHHSGVVDENNRVLLGGLPGHGLHKIAGAKVEEIDALDDNEVRNFVPSGVLSDLKGDYEVSLAFGLLHLEGASSAGSLSDGHWANHPIASHHYFGEGEVFILAGNFCDNFYSDFAAFLKARHEILSPIKNASAKGVYGLIREKDSKRYLTVINFSSDACEVQLDDSLTQRVGQENKSVQLPPFGISVLEVDPTVVQTEPAAALQD